MARSGGCGWRGGSRAKPRLRFAHRLRGLGDAAGRPFDGFPRSSASIKRKKRKPQNAVSDCRKTPRMHRRGRSPFDCNPQVAACTSPRSGCKPLPISISGRKMSVFGPARVKNAILQEIDDPIERLLADFRWQSIDFVDALKPQNAAFLYWRVGRLPGKAFALGAAGNAAANRGPRPRGHSFMAWRSRGASRADRMIFTASPGRKGSTHRDRLSARARPLRLMNQAVPST